MNGFFTSNHARAICAGVAFFFSAYRLWAAQDEIRGLLGLRCSLDHQAPIIFEPLKP